MEACSNKPLNTPVWKQQTILNLNISATHPDATQTATSAFLPLPRVAVRHVQPLKHSHSRMRHAWTQVNDMQAPVDGGSKK